jgi:RNA polymerase sigma-70 factor (ECF subfamily)
MNEHKININNSLTEERVHGASLAVRQETDEVLITRFQQGEEQVFRFLVERYKERIRNLIYSILNDRDIVDDISQEVFIRVYRALPRFRFQSSFYTWLYRIAVNRSRDELRRRKIRRFFSLQAMMEDGGGAIESQMSVVMEDSSVQESIAKGLQSLPEKYRVPIILKDIDGLSYEEMAGVMKCEIGTVKSRLSRGRSMLRDYLKPLLES